MRVLIAFMLVCLTVSSSPARPCAQFVRLGPCPSTPLSWCVKTAAGWVPADTLCEGTLGPTATVTEWFRASTETVPRLRAELERSKVEVEITRIQAAEELAACEEEEESVASACREAVEEAPWYRHEAFLVGLGFLGGVVVTVAILAAVREL